MLWSSIQKSNRRAVLYHQKSLKQWKYTDIWNTLLICRKQAKKLNCKNVTTFHHSKEPWAVIFKRLSKWLRWMAEYRQSAMMIKRHCWVCLGVLVLLRAMSRRKTNGITDLTRQVYRKILLSNRRQSFSPKAALAILRMCKLKSKFQINNVWVMINQWNRKIAIGIADWTHRVNTIKWSHHLS
jgi:intein-encoded DNA endonuclease-like protein